MMEMIQYPFMQRALIAGVLLSIGLAYLGIFVMLKRLAFYSEGLAHASLAGVAAGLLLGIYPLYTALAVGVLFAVAVHYLEEYTTLAPDSLIGILFTTGMALGLVMMSTAGGYRPELTSFLFGSILTVTPQDVLVILIFFAVTVLFFTIAHSKMLLMAIDRDLAFVSGVPVRRYRLCMYIILSVSIVLGVKLVGVVLVSALLVIPVATAKLVSSSFRSLVVGTITLAPFATVLGVLLSYRLDIPAGPMIILTFSFLFAVTFLYRVMRVRW